MRYLLLSVLVVFIVGIMITSASASFHCADRGGSVCLEYNPNGTCKSSMCASDYEKATSGGPSQAFQFVLDEAHLFGMPFLTFWIPIITTIVVIIIIIRKIRRKNRKPVRQQPRFCENCGNILKPTAKFCAKCGIRRF